MINVKISSGRNQLWFEGSGEGYHVETRKQRNHRAGMLRETERNQGGGEKKTWLQKRVTGIQSLLTDVSKQRKKGIRAIHEVRVPQGGCLNKRGNRPFFWHVVGKRVMDRGQPHSVGWQKASYSWDGILSVAKICVCIIITVQLVMHLVSGPTIWSTCKLCAYFQHFLVLLCAAHLESCGQQLYLIRVVSHFLATCKQFISSAIMIPKIEVKV